MWLGAHPGDPSRLRGGPTLLDAVRDDPDGMLGADRARKWDATLPFLLKVLAADEPLSLQAHPSMEQARTGFARGGSRAGIAPDAADRNYRDANHKPELICALTEFHALVGFRDARRHRRAAARAGGAGARRLHRAARRPARPRRAARAVHHLDHAAPGAARQAGAGPAGRLRAAGRGRRAVPHGGAHGAGALGALPGRRRACWPRCCSTGSRCAPGEALYLPAGNLHAYLQGAGIELMANSDNVLRGGLTPKHVDVPELLRVLDFDGRAAARPHRGARRARGCATTPRRGVPAAPLRDRVRGRPVRRCPTAARGSCCAPRAPRACGGGGRELELARGASAWLARGGHRRHGRGTGRRAPSCSSPATRLS